MYAQVWLNLPIEKPLWYSVPEKFITSVQPYTRVYVDFEGEKKIGFVSQLFPNIPEKTHFDIKPILKIIDKERILSEIQLRLAKRISQYYFVSFGEVIFSMLPQAKREFEEGGDFSYVANQELLPELTDEQDKILKEILSFKPKGKIYTHLIHGITGSGKTRLYLELIKHYLSFDLGVIYLVPEIALSYQIYATLEPFFGEEMVFWHSQISFSKKFREYKKLLKAQKKFILGTRSAIFAPVHRLALIIIDEEHDNSYKGKDTLPYSARRVAYFQLEESETYNLPKLIILGSATPSVESYYFSQKKIFFFHELKKRATGQNLADVHIPFYHKDMGPISPFLKEKMEYHLSRNHQVMLILNRRGHSNYALCPRCEKTERCPHCSVSLTYHKQGELICHLCGFRKNFEKTCHSCHGPLLLIGSGIQKVEDFLERQFPKVSYIRIDQDNIKTREELQALIPEIREGKVQILLGTQMLAKGFDLPHLTLVGILNADIGLSLPDFRASERVFQLLVQAAGRSGRHRKGEVVMQTMMPNHPAIYCAARQKYQEFYEKELEFRNLFGYPPFFRLCRILFTAQDQERILTFCRKLSAYLQNELSQLTLFSSQNAEKDTEILGPVPAPFEKIKDYYRYHLIIKAKTQESLHQKVTEIYHTIIKKQLASFSDVSCKIDVDPVDLL